MSIRGKTAIVGFAELPTRKEYPGRTTLGLYADVVGAAIRDAGLRKEDIDGLITGIEGLNSLNAGEGMGIWPRYTASMTVRGASGAAAVATAAEAVAAGVANYVVCVLGESREASSSRVRGVAAARRTPPPTLASEWEAPFGTVVGANTGYGLMKQRYMYQYGATQEQFAKCAVDERFNGAHNENGVWYEKPITIDDVLNSRFTNDPLHLLEMVMPCSGAFAVVVTSAERARALPHPAAYILGVGGPASRREGYWNAADDITVTPVVQSAPTALQMAQVNASDVQFAEFYDCYTILVMACLEDAGIVKKGEIGPFYAATDTTFKGSFPINTDGGQIGAGQPGGNSGGFRHVVEAARQIMGRAGARQVPRKDLCLVNG